MKTAIYFCNCGNTLSERIDYTRIEAEMKKLPGVAFVKANDFLCARSGLEFLEADLKAERPERVVIAACSPREYQATFMEVLGRAEINPYFLQIANIREQVAWVTPDPAQATEKACAQMRGAVARVGLHHALEKKDLDACRDVAVIGAGPAGLQCALTLAETGRRVVLVEKSPAIGGMPVRYEDLFPALECAPCMIEPIQAEVQHGPHSANIEILTMAEVTEVKGYYGNFTLQVRQRARFVDAERCIGCGECISPCPITGPNEFNYGLDQRKAIAMPFPGALPNAPFLDDNACLRRSGDDCTLCRDACPIPDTVLYDDKPRTLTRNVGAIVVAIGAGLYDCRRVPQLGYGVVPGVYTSAEFERILASNGPTGGELRKPGGAAPESVAIVHCVGSLDAQHQPYCSGVCCEYAFKFNHLIEKKQPGVKTFHLYKELVMAGKEEYALYRHAQENQNASFVRYRGPVRVTGKDNRSLVEFEDTEGRPGSVAADMVVLCPAMTGAGDADQLGGILDAPLDAFGFFEELHGRLHSAQSKMKGIYLAGACQAPMDIQRAVSQGMASAGYVLSGLADGHKLDISPVTAAVDETRCSRCRTCGSVCPYKAISYPADRESAYVNPLLCQGCGTCVAACPAGAIAGHHFTDEQIIAEIKAVLC